MQKLNFLVEVEINGQWVHANVATLAEAQALLSVLESSNNAIYETIFDADIFLNKDATEEDRNALDAYNKQQFATLAQKLGLVA